MSSQHVNKQNSLAKMASRQVLLLENDVSATSNAKDVATAQIKRFITEHREQILKYLEPSYFFSLYHRLDIPDVLTICEIRKDKVKRLLSKMDKRDNNEIYYLFLNILENETEHLGHEWLFALFSQTPLADEDIIQQSREIEQCIIEKISKIEVLLDITDSHMQAALLSIHLLTNDEIEKLRQKKITKREKVHEFVTILSTKGPTAYYTFVNKVLGRLNNTARDQELYEELIQKLPTRKRRASTSVVEYVKFYVRLSKYHPHSLKASKGIRRTKYMEEFRLIRKYEQMGKNERRISNSILNRLISSPDTPLDVKIIALLESCNKLCYTKEAESIELKIKEAQEMCAQLHIENQNSQALEALCLWMYAKFNRCISEYDTALKYISSAYQLLEHCEPCEAHILVYYCHGCILQDKTIESNIAIKLFDISFSYGNNEDYGLRVSHIRIRKAQKYLGTSSNNPGISNTVSHENLAMAKALLDSISEETEPRTKCLIEYTRSDFQRLSGNIEEAKDHYKIALNLARKYELQFELHSLHIRTHSLNMSIEEQNASCPFC